MISTAEMQWVQVEAGPYPYFVLIKDKEIVAAIEKYDDWWVLKILARFSGNYSMLMTVKDGDSPCDCLNGKTFSDNFLRRILEGRGVAKFAIDLADLNNIPFEYKDKQS